MPYSDPLADGPVIQQSSVAALRNGISIKKILEQLKESKEERAKMKKVPLVLMGYLNPVMQYGFEEFCRDARDAGVSGIILPDLPLPEYESEYKKIVEENGLSFIFLITPETSVERIRKIDELSSAFIYAVSSSSTTGSDTNFEKQAVYFKKLRDLNLKNKVLIGFGIRDRHTFDHACEYATGAIIGTAFIKALEKQPDENVAVEGFLNSILPAKTSDCQE